MGPVHWSHFVSFTVWIDMGPVRTNRHLRWCLVVVLLLTSALFLFSVMHVRIYAQRLQNTEHRNYAGHLASDGVETDSKAELVAMYLQRLTDLRITGKNVRRSTCSDNPANAAPCLNKFCNATFAPPNRRLLNILQSQYPIKDEHVATIGNMSEQSQDVDVTFLVAGSRNHFQESQGVLKDLYEKVFPYLKNHSRFSFRLVYYDLGLSKPQLSLLKKHCDCSVLPFPFDSFPQSFKLLGTCIWKPVIVKAHLRRSRFVLWMDASTRFKEGNITAIVQHADRWGVYVSRNGWMLPQHVAQPMMDYFRVKPCLLSPFYELAGGFLVFKKDVLTERAIVDPWVACAFSPDCLCPGKDCIKFKGHCNNQTRPYSRCHRFDQSALAIILVTLFDYRVSGLVSTDFGRLVHFALGDKVDYFPPEG